MAAKIAQNDYNSCNIYFSVEILVITFMFWGSKNLIWSIQILLNNLISCKSKMVAKMAAKLAAKLL